MNPLVVVVAVAGTALFLYSYVEMWHALRKTRGTIQRALWYLFLTSIAYVLSAGTATFLVGIKMSPGHAAWMLVPVSGILTGLLWARSASDWLALIRHAGIAEEVAEKAGGNL